MVANRDWSRSAVLVVLVVLMAKVEVLVVLVEVLVVLTVSVAELVVTEVEATAWPSRAPIHFSQ